MSQYVLKMENFATCPNGDPTTAAQPSSRTRFLRAAHCQPVDRPPVWLMRQAGRCLPEYRALKEKFTFVQMVQTPDLAAEITLQPIRRFGFDAAILFSDILVIPEALGQNYQFADQGGIEMDWYLDSAADVTRLDPSSVAEKLQYVPQAIQRIKRELHDQTALLGFAGSPWTLANYMLEGSAKEFTKAKALFLADSKLFGQLMEKLCDAITIYLQMQIQAGVDAVQIFDSSGGILSDSMLGEASARWMQRIIASLNQQVPVTVFSKGANGSWDALAQTGASILSVDWTMNLRAVRDRLPAHIGVQGNLDPFLLTTTPAIVHGETKRLLQEMRGVTGFICNLGHGVPPAAKLENIQALVNTVQSF